MARMRTLKPEFWDSPSTAKASLPARLLFLAMWNWADDSGRGTAGLKELEAFAFPNDDIGSLCRDKAGDSAPMAGTSPEVYRSFAELCGDVADAYGVMFYKVNNRPYYVIPSFKSHQAKDFRAASKYPTEDEGETFDITGNIADFTPTFPTRSGQELEQAGDSAHDAGDSAGGAGEKKPVIGEEGKRVRGEQKKPAQPTADAAESSNPANEATTDAYERVGKAFKFVAVLAIAKWAIKERGVDPNVLADAFVHIYDMGKPITKQTVGQCLDGKLGQRGNAKQTTGEKMLDTMARGQALQDRLNNPGQTILQIGA